MSMVSSKEGFRNTYPKSFPTIIASVGGLAVFLILASTILVSEPFGATVRGYFYGVDRSQKIGVDPSVSTVGAKPGHVVNPFEGAEVNVTGSRGQEDDNISRKSDRESDDSGKGSGKGDVNEKVGHKEYEDKNGLANMGQVESSSPPAKEESHPRNQEVGSKSPPVESTFQPADPVTDTNTQTVSDSKESSPDTRNTSQAHVFDSGCDLHQGKWVYDTTGPLYTNNSCPVITQMQNCQGNGRPDKEYENWRWKPSKCDLPRLDPKKFLEIMRGKTLAFIGDSVARNQMESMLCILWQVEEPKNRGNKKMQRYYFRSTSTMIVRIWSSWLVHQTSDAFGSAPAGVVKLHLDKPDEVFMEYISDFDVVVLSSGHWFAKQSVYVLNNEIVGGQLWWPHKSKPMKIDNVAAFGVSVETILTSMATHPNYTGLTIVRSFSPDHYEGGAWNTGGSCTGKVQPALEGQLVENGFTNIMHEKQVAGFNRAVKSKSNKSSLKLLDITEMYSYRHDGHPGPYRSPDPKKITKRGPDGRPPPQDCLHWCMPGPVDTWNELVFEIIRRDFSDRQNSSS